jgi:hypothetical protein
MKTKKTHIEADTRPRIKVQLDYRTMIVVRTMNAFKAWKERYPDAKLIE